MKVSGSADNPPEPFPTVPLGRGTARGNWKREEPAQDGGATAIHRGGRREEEVRKTRKYAAGQARRGHGRLFGMDGKARTVSYRAIPPTSGLYTQSAAIRGATGNGRSGTTRERRWGLRRMCHGTPLWFFGGSLSIRKTPGARNCHRAAGYFPASRYCISSTPGDRMRAQTNRAKHFVRKPTGFRAGTVCGRRFQHLEKEIKTEVQPCPWEDGFSENRKPA